MLEHSLIEHASPTLARLKTGSLFNIYHESEEGIKKEIRRMNRDLAPKGLVLTVLRMDKNRALLYLFRCAHLRLHLAKAEVQKFLAAHGYNRFSVADALKTLRNRIAALGDFPHEIGIFLDYPLSDVVDFIRHKGQNSRLTGVWKVYSNESDAMKTFARFKKCKDVYRRQYQSGRPISRLAVAT